MAHHVPAGARQLTKGGPQRAQPGDIEQALTVVKTEIHPAVVVRQVSPSPLTTESATASIGDPQRPDQGCDVSRERGGCREAGRCGDVTGEPGLYRPWQRVAVAGQPQRDRAWAREKDSALKAP